MKHHRLSGSAWNVPVKGNLTSLDNADIGAVAGAAAGLARAVGGGIKTTAAAAAFPVILAAQTAIAFGVFQILAGVLGAFGDSVSEPPQDTGPQCNCTPRYGVHKEHCLIVKSKAVPLPLGTVCRVKHPQCTLLGIPRSSTLPVKMAGNDLEIPLGNVLYVGRPKDQFHNIAVLVDGSQLRITEMPEVEFLTAAGVLKLGFQGHPFSLESVTVQDLHGLRTRLALMLNQHHHAVREILGAEVFEQFFVGPTPEVFPPPQPVRWPKPAK